MVIFSILFTLCSLILLSLILFKNLYTENSLGVFLGLIGIVTAAIGAILGADYMIIVIPCIMLVLFNSLLILASLGSKGNS